MSRSYRNVRPKKECVYSVEDIQRLYSVSANTVSNWIGAGLRPSDDTIPKLFRGAELIRFHKARRINASVPLRIGQFKCFGCKTRVFPLPKGLIFSKEAGRKCYIMGHCPDCNGVVHKWVNETDCDKIAQCVDTNTSLDSLDEEIRAIPVGIGNGGVPEFDVVPNSNDRLIHDWLKLAGQWDEKTVLVKLASIRMFEAFLGRKSFSYLTEGDVTAYRDDLKASVHPDADVPLSVATVRHRASHLRGFLAWLLNQKACTALPRSLPDLLQLPKKFHAPTSTSVIPMCLVLLRPKSCLPECPAIH